MLTSKNVPIVNWYLAWHKNTLGRGRLSLWNVLLQRPGSSIPTAQLWRLSWPGWGLAQLQGTEDVSVASSLDCPHGCFPSATPVFAFTCMLPRQGPHQSKKGSSWFQQGSCGRARGQGSKAAVGEADSGPLPLQAQAPQWPQSSLHQDDSQRGDHLGWGLWGQGQHTPTALRVRTPSQHSWREKLFQPKAFQKGYVSKSPDHHGNCEMRSLH